MSLTKNPQPQPKIFYSSADQKTCRIFWNFDQVRNTDWMGEIPTQSHAHFGVFFRKSVKAAGCQSVKANKISNTVTACGLEQATTYTSLLTLHNTVMKQQHPLLA